MCTVTFRCKYCYFPHFYQWGDRGRGSISNSPKATEQMHPFRIQMTLSPCKSCYCHCCNVSWCPATISPAVRVNPWLSHASSKSHPNSCLCSPFLPPFGQIHIFLKLKKHSCCCVVYWTVLVSWKKMCVSESMKFKPTLSKGQVHFEHLSECFYFTCLSTSTGCRW